MDMKEKGYTNHSLRVSGITNLTHNNFSNKQIMSISGHKSVESLAIYQKVNANEKLKMGLTLGYSLLHQPQEQQIIAPAQVLPLQEKQNVMLALPPPEINEPPQKKAKMMYEPESPLPQEDTMLLAIPLNADPFDDDFDMSDQELMKIIPETANTMEMTQDKARHLSCNETTVTKQLVQKKTSPRPQQLFTNYTFTGNVTININKNWIVTKLFIG